MEVWTTVLLGVLIISVWGLIAAVIWLALRGRQGVRSGEVSALQAEMQTLREQVGQGLQTVTQHIAVFGSVQEGIGKVTEATRQILALGQDVASLQEILRAPKLRGGLGEILLGNLLAQVLPCDRYRLQYAFEDGTRVDAAIFLADHILPIDAKFPLESFQRMADCGEEKEHDAARREFVRSVKLRVDETAGYIRPEKGTFDFAMMYIPAENVYYEILSGRELFEYALERRVVPVSPNTFFAYLNVVVFGLRGLKVEENARLLLGYLSRLAKDYQRMREAYSKLGTHIAHAQSKYNEVDAQLGRFGERLNDVASGSALAPAPEPPALPG